MRRLLMALAILLPQLAAAATTVEVLETFPAGTSLRLPDGQTYYVRLAYTTDTPTSIWVTPHLNGKPANAGSNPSSTYPVGSGEALGWFFLMEAGAAVDELHIQVGDGSVGGNQLVQRIPVNIVAVNRGDAPVGAEPEWVARMRAADRERRDRETQQIMQDSGGGGAGIAFGLMAAVLLVLVGAIAWPIRARRRWSGGWRTAATVPLAVIGFVVVRIIVGTAMDPTSHNLWPFEIVLVGAASIAAMVVLVIARRVRGVTE